MASRPNSEQGGMKNKIRGTETPSGSDTSQYKI